MMAPFYLLIAVLPLVRHQFWSYTSLAGLSMNKWLGLAALAGACLHLATRSTAPRPFATPQAPLFLTFGLFVILSFLFRGPEKTPVELSPVGNWISFLLLFGMAAIVVDSRGRLKWTLFFAIGGIAFASLHLLREWQGWGGMAAGVRPGWVTGDPNYFSLSALTCLPLAFLFSEVRLPGWQRIAMRLCLVICLAAFILAASRGGLLGLGLSFLLLAWHSRRRFQFLAVGGALLLCLVLVAPTSPLLRFFSTHQADISSTATHERLLWSGLRLFQDHFLLGIGVGNFKSMIEEYDDIETTLKAVAHNTYLEVACELGIFGLLLMIAIIALSFRTLRRVRIATAHGRDPFLHLVARGLEAGLAGGCVAMFFITALHSRLVWFMIIVTMCLPAIPRPAIRRARVASVEPSSATERPS